jgi:hypothetical protein
MNEGEEGDELEGPDVHRGRRDFLRDRKEHAVRSTMLDHDDISSSSIYVGIFFSIP